MFGAVIEERADLDPARELRNSSRVIGVIVRDDDVVNVVDAGRFRGEHDAVRVSPVEIVPARVNQQRFTLRIDDQRGLPAFHVNEIYLQRLRSRRGGRDGRKPQAKTKQERQESGQDGACEAPVVRTERVNNLGHCNCTGTGRAAACHSLVFVMHAIGTVARNAAGFPLMIIVYWRGHLRRANRRSGSRKPMAENDRIGILTGGGDVPGLNPVIKSVVYGGSEIRRPGGRNSQGLGGPDLHDQRGRSRHTFAISRATTRARLTAPAARCCTPRGPIPRRVPESKLPKHLPKEQLKKLPFDGKTYDLTSIVLANLEKLQIGCLVAIGGDDTLSFASVLSAAGFPVIAIPKTMDNDVQGTEYCIGFSTAVTRAKQSITRQRTTVGSHERIGIFPNLRPRRRLHRAVHRVRHLHALPDSRASVSISIASAAC